MGRLGRRLSRILVMLPYAIQHPGTTVSELADRFSVPRDEVLNDLNLVFLCGLPGYGPGDLIDVDVQDDRIYIHMADYFAAPLRLTPAEALALYAGGRAISDLPELAEADSLRGALAKLGKALGAAAERGSTGATVDVRLEAGPSDHLGVLQRALEQHKRVHLEYFSASRSELSTRDLDPWGLVAALGRWYVVGLDHRSGEERMFRVDRIKHAELTEADAPVPADFDITRYKGAFGGEGEETVTLEISPQAARWFEDYYPVKSARALEDGWREVELVASSNIWSATLLLRLGWEARNVRPSAVVDTAKDLARSIAKRHS